jgi:O-antigen/teichoic acid export membrane protein
LPALTISKAFQAYQVCRYSALILVGVILAKQGYTTEDIGLFETFILVSGISSFFWLNGMLNTYIVRNKTASGDPLVSLIITVSLFTAGVIALLILLSQPFSRFFSVDTSFLYYLIPFIAVNNFSFITEHILLAREKVNVLLGLGAYHLLILPLLVLTIALNGGDIYAIMTGMIIFLLAKDIYMVILTGKRKVAGSAWKPFLYAGIPLTLSYLFGGISVYADGVIVNHFYSKGEFAMYQYGAREFPLSMLLANAFSIVMVQQLSRNTGDGLHEIKMGSMRLWHQLFPIGIVLMVISPYVFPVVFNEQFSNSYIYFNIYLLLIIPRLLFPQSILIAKGMTGIQMRISIIEFFINIISSLILMQYLGLAGIAWGTVIAYTFEKTAMVIIAGRKGYKFASYTHRPVFVFYSIALLAAFVITTLPSLL